MKPKTADPRSTREAIIASVIVALGSFLIVFFSLKTNVPPDVVSTDAPPGVFSAERAAMHLPHIASMPNPIGSRANEDVRLYITEQIELLGLTPELHFTELFQTFSTFQRVTTLKNVLVKIPGTIGEQTIMVMGHYDTVANAPGASDNGAAVVSMLEVIRMLQHHPPLENNLIIFFPDGEEYGLLGARAFKEQHRWAADIDLIINLEAMGTSGQSLMFETGENNLELIREFARAVPYPVANSLSVEVYKRIGRATDYDVFKHDGYPGLNFAYIGSSFDYHTAGDNIENTDLRSVQHHGSHLAALVLHFGNTSFDLDATDDAVYFNTIGHRIVYYPYSYAPFIGVLIFIITIAAIGWGIRAKQISPVKILYSLVSFVIHLVMLYFAFNALYGIIASYYPGASHRLLDYNALPILMGFTLMAIAFSIFFFHLVIRGARTWQLLYLFSWLLLLLWHGGDMMLPGGGLVVIFAGWMFFAHRKPTQVFNLWAGVLLLWAMLAVTIAFILPGASYLLAWPLLFGLVPFAIAIYTQNANLKGYLAPIIIIVTAIPVLTWFPWTMKVFILASGLSVIGIVVGLSGLVMGLLVPHSFLLTRTKPWLIPAAVFIAGLIITLTNTSGLEYNERHRKQNQVVFASDGITGKTYFIARSDSWTKQFVTDHPDTLDLAFYAPYRIVRTLGKKSEGPPLPSPRFEVLRDTVSDGERMLELFFQSAWHPTSVRFYVTSDNNRRPAVRVGETGRHQMQEVQEAGWYQLIYLSPPGNGFLLTLYANFNSKVDIHIVEEDVAGLPCFIEYQKRPEHMMPAGDRTISAHFFGF